MRTVAAALCMVVAGLTANVAGAQAVSQEEALKQLAESKEVWQTLKEKCGGNYEYTVRFNSFTGFGNATTVKVQDNAVVERKYVEFVVAQGPVRPGTEPPKPTIDYVETGAEIGKHERGAPPKTLDELYAHAAEDLGAEQPESMKDSVRYYFKADKHGLVRNAFWIDTRIADDSPRSGVVINELKLELPE